jgi:hypothetical protein
MAGGVAMDTSNPCSGDHQSALGASAGRGWVSQMRTAWHAPVWVGLSGQRRFVPRASTAVNYKLCLNGTKMAGFEPFPKEKDVDAHLVQPARGCQKWVGRCPGE